MFYSYSQNLTEFNIIDSDYYFIDFNQGPPSFFCKRSDETEFLLLFNYSLSLENADTTPIFGSCPIF